MRADKLIEVSEKLKIAVKNLNAVQKEYEGALRNYQLVEHSFDLGEEVFIADMGHAPLIRSELRYLGPAVIVKIHDNLRFDIKLGEKIYEKVGWNLLERSNSSKILCREIIG